MIKRFSQLNESDSKSNTDYDEQLKKGIKVESEHCDIYEELKEWMDKTFQEYSTMPWTKEEFYEKISKAHIKEIPDYYDRLEKIEK